MHEPTVIIDPVELLRPYPAAEMGAYPVNKKVNSPASQGPELVERIGT